MFTSKSLPTWPKEKCRRGGMEATVFSSWIYREIEPLADEIWMGHPARMKAICSGKKKTDKLDARMLSDLLRSNLFPRCYVMDARLEALRRQLRLRRLVVSETVRFKNKTAGLLMEDEPGDPECFYSIKNALRYCGLTSALRESAGKEMRGPLSKQRNAYLQTVLIETAKLAPRFNETLKAVQEKERARGHANRATLAVARNLVAYLLAVDRAHFADLQQAKRKAKSAA